MNQFESQFIVHTVAKHKTPLVRSGSVTSVAFHATSAAAGDVAVSPAEDDNASDDSLQDSSTSRNRKWSQSVVGGNRKGLYGCRTKQCVGEPGVATYFAMIINFSHLLKGIEEIQSIL